MIDSKLIEALKNAEKGLEDAQNLTATTSWQFPIITKLLHIVSGIIRQEEKR